MDGYTLTRNWFDFAFHTTDCKYIHTAIYLWIVELNNRLQWKKEFGLPTSDTMEGLGIGNKVTYLTALKKIEEWGFIQIIHPSKNQFQANIIRLCHSKKATAPYTALQQHNTQHSNNTDASTVPIDKQRNKETKKQYIYPSEIDVINYFKENGYTELSAKKAFNYYSTASWKDSKGKQVKNWKQKMIGVWFKDENKTKENKLTFSQ